jgi:hypothetical protein
MRERGESEPAMRLRDDHAKETLVLDELPGVRRQISQFGGDLPIVQSGAERFGRPVEEGLLLGGQCRPRQRAHRVPIGVAGEQVAVPPHGAGFDRFALGIRHRRQHLAIPVEHRGADELPS